MPVLAKVFLDIQATLECGFTLKRGCDMIRTYSQMHRRDKDSQNSSIIWPVCPSFSVFVYGLSGFGFEYRCSPFNFRYGACFEYKAPWHSGNYRVWIHSEVGTWDDKNIQSNVPYRQLLTTKLYHLANLSKLLRVLLSTKWFWVSLRWQSLQLQKSPLFGLRMSLIFRQLESVD